MTGAPSEIRLTRSRCLPLASIAPPASLTVLATTANTTVREPVPEVHWRNIPYEATGAGYYNGPGQDMIRLAAATAYSLSPLPNATKYQNYSYDLTFSSPRLRCGPVPAEDQQQFDDDLIPLEDDFSDGSLNRDYYKAMSFSLNTNSQYDIWVRTRSANFTCQT